MVTSTVTFSFSITSLHHVSNSLLPITSLLSINSRPVTTLNLLQTLSTLPISETATLSSSLTIHLQAFLTQTLSHSFTMPKTKQSALKSSGRGKNVDLSSSSAPIPENPMPSKKRALLPERGFSLENPNPDFLSTVAALGWQKFIVHRKEYIATVVHDFYNGIVERGDDMPSNTSIVRGEEVSFSPRVINDYFGLGYYGKAIETKQKTYGIAEMAALKGRICVEGAVWERSGDHGNEFKILRKYLTEEANTWFHFIRHCLVPTTHNLWVDKERLIVIDAIMSRDKIEVGKFINREMNKWQNRKDGHLYFPCLITELCMDAGVEIEASELREEPQGPFSTKFKSKQRPENVTTSVDTRTLQRLVQQQNSLASFVKKQFEWQKKINAHLTKGKMVIEEPVLPDWVTDVDAEEEEDDVPLAEKVKAVKKEKIKRARSPARRKKSPARKKQKKVSVEVLSDDEEEEEIHSEKSSSGDNPDFVADSPPIQIAKQPTQEPLSPKPQSPTKPPTHDQSTPQSKAQDQPIPQPSPTQPEPVQETQQTSHQEAPSGDVAKSAAAEVGSNPEQRPKSPPKKQRVKTVPTHRPFGKKKRSEIAAASGEAKNDEEPTKPADVEKAKRQKLQIKKKSEAEKGKPATATSAAFISPSGSEAVPVVVAEDASEDVPTSAEREAAEKLAELQAIRDHDDAVQRAKDQALEEATQRLAEHLLKQAQDKAAAAVGDIPADVPTSQGPEVEKAQVDPKEPEQADPEQLAKQSAWEEAKNTIAETSAKLTQQAEVSVAAAASSGAVGSDATTTTEAGGDEKKKKERKKKGAQASAKPVRQSGRLRSGALPK